MRTRTILLMLSLFFAGKSFSQFTIKVFINGTLSGQYNIKEGQTDSGLWYKKKLYRNMQRLSIEVKGASIQNAMYKRVVDITDEKENSLFNAAETPGIPGQFNLTDKVVLKTLAGGKKVKLYLLLDPANEMIKAPSRRYFIGNLTGK